MRTIHGIEAQLIAGEKTLSDITGELRNWKARAKELGGAAFYDSNGGKVEQRLKDLRGEVSSLKLDKAFPPEGGTIAKLDESVLAMQVWIDEERAITKPTAIINDRLIFAATNYAPLLSLRDRFKSKLSEASAAVAAIKREYDKEMTAKKVEVAKMPVKWEKT